jgi:V/A-type H+-transporting ATPase subunit E
MESKLQELTKRIYDEGVDKAKKEAEVILSNAKDEASRIINNAKKEAEEIILKAKNDSTQLTNKVNSELKLAANQAMSSLKQKITELISSNAFSVDIKKALDDKEFIKNIIKTIVEKWDDKDKALNLDLILPSKAKQELLDHFKKNSGELLGKGVELKFEDRMSGGFKISSKDGSFILSFTDADFEEFFKSFLKPKTKEIIFS